MRILAMARVVFFGSVLLANQAALGAIITFDDRATFEAFLSGEVTDDLLDITQGAGLSGVRSGYSWSMNSYGCVTTGCGDPTSQGMSYADNFFVSYEDGTFDFGSEIFAFGVDFGSFSSAGSGDLEQISLNGLSSISTNVGGFFGIVSAGGGSGFTSVTFTQTTAFAFLDKITYSSAAVPEPSTALLLSCGLMGLGVRRRRRH